LETASVWTAKATATSTITGRNSLSLNFDGSVGFTVFLSELASPEKPDAPVVPQNSVAGRVVGTFNVQISTPTRELTAEGAAGWTIGGTYDPASESVSIAIRSSGVNATGLETPLGDAAQGVTPTAEPFSARFGWGWPAPTQEDPSTILNAMKPGTAPVIPSERERDLLVVNCLPQTGLAEFQRIVLDLKEPEPQTFTHTFQDETDLGTRTTTWVFALIPAFNIERDDRGMDGVHSCVSTDVVRVHMAIPGVTVAKSGWTNLASWEVKGLSLLSGGGVPNRLPNSTAFSFQPNPGNRPTGGSTDRNRPLQYDVSAAFEGIVQHFMILQDNIDIFRQEYIDHRERVVPSRSDCVAQPVDGSFNAGNYDLVVDGGMQAAFGRVSAEFGKVSQGALRVVGGFRSPQRNMATGDSHPGNAHVYGRALDLVPDPANADSLNALYQACVKAGYHALLEAAPGKSVPQGSLEAKHVHIDW